jgi:hypothetical protein
LPWDVLTKKGSLIIFPLLGLSISAPSASRAYLQGSTYGLNFTIPSSTANAPAFLLSRGVSKLSDISAQVSCTNDTAGVAFECQWPVPAQMTEGAGYTIAVTVVNTTWIDTTPGFGIVGIHRYFLSKGNFGSITPKLCYF